MTPRERRTSISLAAIFALRMFGLFLVLPVFAIHARKLPGGDDPLLVGLALGVYGLTQALLQLPLGIASDRVGRKPVIVGGLLVFALGSFVAAIDDTVVTVIVGRALQGAGAVSAAVSAMVADGTRDSQRTKAMAMIGGSIAVSFLLSLVLGPLLHPRIGMTGIFVLTGVLALLAIAILLWAVPSGAAAAAHEGERTPTAPVAWSTVLLDRDLLRLNFGIFALHAAQIAMFVVVPAALIEQAGLPLERHWQVYLVVTLVSFALMMPPLLWAERRGRLKSLFLAAIGLLALVQLGLMTQPASLGLLAVLLTAFFAGFNTLEAGLPSLISRLAPAGARGAAMGVYNTSQSLGLFAGGALGGWLAARGGGVAVHALCGILMVAWWIVTRGQTRWPVAGGRVEN
jgi:MFS family permease